MSKAKKKKHQWGGMVLMLLWALIAVAVLYVIMVIKPDFSIITERFEQAKNAPKIVQRTDVLVCYQQNGHPYLANLSYGLRDGMTETYGVNGEVSAYSVKAGDFIEMTYEITYPNTEGDVSPTISLVESCQKITFSEAEEKRLYGSDVSSFAVRRTAGAYPIGLYLFPEQNRQDDFIIVPVGERYYLYTTASDEPQIFDEYRTIEKNVGKEKPLRVRVLCNEKVRDEAILEALYKGTIGNYSDVFFVGYEAPYPLTIYYKNSELSHLFEMQKYFISVPEGGEDVFLQITPENQDTVSIPKEVQSVLDTDWNKRDHVIVYSRSEGMTDGVSLSYNVNNCLTVYDNGGDPMQGYWIFYVEPSFFEYVVKNQQF